jgi:hypothetical protein
MTISDIGQKSRSAYVPEGMKPATRSASNGRNEGLDLSRAYQLLTGS